MSEEAKRYVATIIVYDKDHHFVVCDKHIDASSIKMDNSGNWFMWQRPDGEFVRTLEERE
jgi:hypothetical protein